MILQKNHLKVFLFFSLKNSAKSHKLNIIISKKISEAIKHDYI